MHFDKIIRLKDRKSDTEHIELVLGRRAVHDLNKKTVAYRLLFDDKPATDAAQDTTHSVLSLLNEFGISHALEGYDGILEVPLSIALTDVTTLLPGPLIVLELSIDIPIDSEVLARLESLKTLGFRLGYAGLPEAEQQESFLSLLDLIRVDPTVAPLEDVKTVMQQLRRARQAKLLAENVDSETDFEACRHLGFDLFEGKYFSSDALLKQKGSQVDKSALLQIVSQLMGDANIRKLDQIFQTSPDLSIRLLKLVNSVGLGPSSGMKISSLKQAILRIGQNQLLRWALLLLYSSGDSQPQRLLFKRVMFRGRFMELAAQHPRFSQGHLIEQAYIVGMLSLADMVVDGTLDEVLKQVGLDDGLRHAILAQQGTLGKLLGLAQAVEDNQRATMILSARNLGLSGRDVSQIQLDAMKWLNSLEKQLT
jgi:EAL and modified HD-GYP domain-containing signal transduction protein